MSWMTFGSLRFCSRGLRLKLHSTGLDHAAVDSGSEWRAKECLRFGGVWNYGMWTGSHVTRPLTCVMICVMTCSWIMCYHVMVTIPHYLSPTFQGPKAHPGATRRRCRACGIPGIWGILGHPARVYQAQQTRGYPRKKPSCWLPHPAILNHRRSPLVASWCVQWKWKWLMNPSWW